jgi:hypothetical protein
MFDKLTSPIEVLTPEQKVARVSYRQARQYDAIAERLDPQFVAAQKRPAPPRRPTVCGNGDPNRLGVFAIMGGVYLDLMTNEEWGAVSYDGVLVGWVKL